MIETIRKCRYKAFGLNILSDIPLPEVPQMGASVNRVDVVIERGDLSKAWSKYANHQKNYITRDSFVMFQVPDTAIFSIQDGGKIIVSPMVGSDEDKIRLYILGTCMGALLMQRKILPLHGSAVVIDGKAYAFVGERGAGKSTLAQAFLNKGYQLLSDDVVAVSITKENGPIVTPSYPQQKLWQECLNEFGMDTRKYHPLFDRETKYAVPVPTKFSSESVQLAGVFELVKSKNEQIDISRIEGLERLHTLYSQTFRNFLIQRLGFREWHFKSCASFVNQIDVYQIRRPSVGFTAHKLASLILSTLGKEEENQ